jgi:aspartyl-tRNA(Asn)/glutamyl-tRNA(Gln) amidotransferase subunit A
LYEFNQILGDTYRAEPDKSLFGPVVQANIAQGEAITDAEYNAAIARRPGEIDEIRDVFRSVDAFITPTHAFVAPPLSVNAEGDPGVRQFTVPVSYTGFPAVSVPCGFNSAGLPVGMQIVANDFEERLLSASPRPSRKSPTAIASRRRSTTTKKPKKEKVVAPCDSEC